MNYAEYKRLLPLVEKIGQDDSDGDDVAPSQLSADIRDSIKGINIVLFGCPDLEEISNKGQWVSEISSFLNNQLKQKNQVDRDFYHVLMFAKVSSPKDVKEHAIKSFMKLDEVTRQRYIKFYKDFSHFWGELDLDEKGSGAISERAALLKERNEVFAWLYERLADYRSKRVLANMICNWTDFDITRITGMKENSFVDYFDPDVFSFSEDEVFVDLGAYIGDTALDFINNIGPYKKIYCYEITQESVDKMADNLKLFSDIEIRNKGVSDKAGTMAVNNSDVRKSANRLGEDAVGGIQVVTLDEDIDEEITLLKMDIEGAEQGAIKGCREHILREKPKLAISVYHSNRDIIEIPKLISSIRDDYKFYLRSHGNQWAPSEITLLGV